MKLIRFVNVLFSPELAAQVAWGAQVGDIELTTIPVNRLAGGAGQLIAAATTLKSPLTRSTEGFVSVPDDVRRELEHAIERAVDVMALSHAAARRLSSPMPCVALFAEGRDDEHWLSESVALHPNRVQFEPGVAPMSFEPTREVFASVYDRPEAVKILAEALSHESSSTRFHGFVRLFEHAFGEASSRLVSPLSRFLAGTFLGFTEDEVREWILDVRHPLIHADLKRQSHVKYDADARPFLGRAQLAAADVLFNKSTWRDATPTRRDVWTPRSGFLLRKAGDGKDIFIVKGYDVGFGGTVIDPFGSYPIDLQAVMGPREGWWTGKISEVQPGNATPTADIFVLPEGASLASTKLAAPGKI